MATNPFTFHTGIQYEESGDQQYGDCIFCGKKKFYFGSGPEYLWDCKNTTCPGPQKGNVYSFLQGFHAILNPAPVSLLAEERGIPLAVLLNNNIRYNQFRSNETYHTFAIPTYNSQGNINNLYRVFPHPEKAGKRLIYSTPSLQANLYNYPSPDSTEQTIWLVEGHWDKLAAEAIVGNRPITCIGWPGSKFDPKWCKVFQNKDLCIFYDKDDAGVQELKRTTDALFQSPHKPKSIKVIAWPDGLPEHFDVNDTLKLQGPQSYQFLEMNLADFESPQTTAAPLIVADDTCDSFEKLLADAASTYYFTPDMELLLLAMITSIYSIRIEGEQIWYRFMGAPGSSKTTMANIVGASSSTIMRDTFTGLLSGWKDEQDQDASMIPLIQDRGLIVKDADALLQQPNIQQIMSELRAFYDKQIAVTYRNRVNYDHQGIRSSFIFCGTHALRDMDNTSLGERFLDFELHVSDDDRKAISLRSLQNAKAAARGGIPPESRIKEKSKGFIDGHLLQKDDIADFPSEVDDRILSLGNLISYMRANVERDYKGNLKYRPYPEVPSRIVKQLTKLYLCAPIVYGTKTIPQPVHDLVSHTVRDIINIDSLRYKICRAMMFFDGPLTGDELCSKLHPAKPERIEQEIQNMVELEMIQLGKRRTSVQLVVNTFSPKPFIAEQMELIL
jgi:hypothetical protein